MYNVCIRLQNTASRVFNSPNLWDVVVRKTHNNVRLTVNDHVAHNTNFLTNIPKIARVSAEVVDEKCLV